MNSKLSEQPFKVEVAPAFAAFIHLLWCWDLTLLWKGCSELEQSFLGSQNQNVAI